MLSFFFNQLCILLLCQYQEGFCLFVCFGDFLFVLGFFFCHGKSISWMFPLVTICLESENGEMVTRYKITNFWYVVMVGSEYFHASVQGVVSNIHSIIHIRSFCSQTTKFFNRLFINGTWKTGSFSVRQFFNYLVVVYQHMWISIVIEKDW